MATINHLCKITAATIQGGIYCNLMIIAMATIQNPCRVQIILLATQYLHTYT